MARGSLPAQTPFVPSTQFFAFNDLYLWLRSLNEDVKLLENAVPATTVEVRTLAADQATGASTTPVDLPGLSWDFEADSVYSFKWVGKVSPAAATTGCGFQLLLT
jgi:hypothetical protein